jgi:hypothetical protein
LTSNEPAWLDPAAWQHTEVGGRLAIAMVAVCLALVDANRTTSD